MQTLPNVPHFTFDAAHQVYLSADKGEAIVIIPAIVLMEVLYLFEKNRIEIGLLQTEILMESRNYCFEPLCRQRKDRRKPAF